MVLPCLVAAFNSICGGCFGWLGESIKMEIQLQGETLNARATQLSQQLQKKDKLLIILDDIWSRFELERVGIPVGNKFTSQFKILMTSRSKMVLEKEMDSSNNFGLDSLPIDDARNLFDTMVGGDAQYSEWPLIAQQVVDQCGGIPILLATTGRALRNENQSIWEDALTQLKQFDGEDFDEDAYKRIEVSYKFLRNEETKKLFLLCAQLDHRSIEFEDLLRYALGLDLFKGRKKLKEVSGRLHKYLRDLKGCCLLQDGNKGGMLKMHDVVYKFATFVAFRDYGVFNVANDGELEEWPSKEQFERFSAVSLFYCRLPSDHHELPAAFDNPNLESFLMLRSKIDASFQIPNNFFAGMKGLKLMNLTRMSLSPVLVSSLGALVKLRTLCLDHCELSDISVIGGLPMLQALSLIGSSIVLIPKEMGKLGRTLKLLDLSDCENLESITAGVIFRLTLLEDLRIGKRYSHWERLEGDDESNNRVDDSYEAKEVASLEEFKSLQNLNNLDIYIPNYAKMFPKDLAFKSLETFKIFIGSKPWYRDYSLPRRLEVSEHVTVVDFDSEGIKTLMTRAENLFLYGVLSSISVSEMDPEGFPELKYVKLQSGVGIQFIIRKNYNNCIFPKLETLTLYSLDNLERISDDHDHPLLVGSFGNLRVVHVKLCKSLKDLLSSDLARCILSLKEIEVEKCESMESIVGSTKSENEEEIQIGFTHQLRVLKLSHLPLLVRFSSFKQIEGLPSTTPLFNKKIMFPELEVLELNEMKIEKIWDFDHLAIAAQWTCWFQNLTSMKVSKCGNLRYLFTSSMAKSFTQLKQVEVSECESIEEIVATKEGEMEGEKFLSFPKLESLELQDLPKLKIFCHANSLECQSLQMLTILGCPLLNAFISTNDSTTDQKMVFPKLDILILMYLKIEKIWHIDHLAITAAGACWFQNLTNLKVSKCKFIEEIVATVGDIQLSFPKLNKIWLNDLPKLRRFCEANLLECHVLRELIIRDCPELKIFVSANDDSSSDTSTTLFNEKVAIPNLEEMRISNCDSLEKLFDVQILPMNERETCILPFQNLRSVYVFGCQSLTSILPQSIMPTCKQVERWEKAFDVQRLSMNKKDTCRNLRSVEVLYCPSLTSIFPPSLVPTLQQLKLLQIVKCENIDLFGFNNTQQLNDALAKLISNLKSCHLEIGSMELIKAYGSVNLKIDGCGFQVPPVFFALLTNFPELEKVEVSTYSITQLFPCQPDNLVAVDGDDMDTQAKTLARIKRLRLTNLSNMKQIWSEHSPMVYHGIIEDLQVAQCDSLLTLAPPSTTLFKNLTGLVVSDCPKLIKLISSPATAKNLVNLKEMSVRKCDSLEEILVIDDQWDGLASNQECIIFDKLEVLTLQYLSSLTSFCSTSDCSFQFPSLNRVFMSNCPPMKFFSKGALSTPKLTRVVEYDGDEDEQWEGDLNSTIRKMFEES